MNLQSPRMNKILWTLQVLWGVFFSQNGFGKICCLNTALWNKSLHDVAWFSAIPQHVFVLIGVCEFLGGLGLILPGITGIKPRLTSFAGAGLTLTMIVAAIFHMVRGEYTFLPINLFLAAGAAFIAVVRWPAQPAQGTRLTSPRWLRGVTVLTAVFLLDTAPVWVKWAHLR